MSFSVSVSYSFSLSTLILQVCLCGFIDIIVIWKKFQGANQANKEMSCFVSCSDYVLYMYVFCYYFVFWLQNKSPTLCLLNHKISVVVLSKTCGAIYVSSVIKLMKYLAKWGPVDWGSTVVYDILHVTVRVVILWFPKPTHKVVVFYSFALPHYHYTNTIHTHYTYTIHKHYTL